MGPPQKSVPRTASAANGVATVIFLSCISLSLPVASRKAAALVLSASSPTLFIGIKDVAIDHDFGVFAKRELGVVAKRHFEMRFRARAELVIRLHRRAYDSRR